MRRVLSVITACLALGMLVLVAPACGGTDEKLGDEQCDNREDDDADGLTDCADPECANADNCTDVGIEHCYNLVDDDNDGDVDCDDSECANTISCVATYESCVSPGDEDGDGQADCEDPDCINTATCTIGAEACDNDADDDGDGDVDCDDDDCANTSACQAQPEDCDNGADDDGDGQADCDDSDCANTAACTDDGEQCTGGADEDSDGRIDCADPDCAYTRTCLGTLEICTNGIDDDGDGVADCADPECQEALACINRNEDCSNRIDDDGDGNVDCDDADCVAAEVCTSEVCDNGTDDDGDGQTDCQDFDCARTSDACECDDLADVDSDDIPNCADDDIDGDGIANDQDNCPYVENADQDDADGDNTGDVCEGDEDGDGVIDDNDNCPSTFNPNQDNQDAAEETADPNDAEEVIGDACEDSDADGWPDIDDNCPNDFNPSQTRDLSADGNAGDACANVFTVDNSDALASGFPPADALSVGDINGDGHDDIVLGSPSSVTNTNKAFVIFGPSFEGTTYLSSSPNVTKISAGSSTANEYQGSVAILGDLNADSMSEFAVGSRTGPSSGEVLIFAGHDTPQQLQPSDAIATIRSSAGARMGAELLVDGDYTGDGTPDLLAIEENTSACSVTLHLFSGALLDSGNLTEADAEFSATSASYCQAPAGTFSLAAGSSITGDSSDDIVFGLPYPLGPQGNIVTTGHVYIFDGSNLPSGAVDANTADVTLSTSRGSDYIGTHLAIDGDFDGDGINDLAVATGSRRALLWSGVSGSTLSGSPAVEFFGGALGGSVTLGLDINQDGASEFATAGSTASSVVRILRGRALSGPTSLDSADGVSISKNFGTGLAYKLDAQLDIDGDGTQDLLMAGQNGIYRFIVPNPAGAP